MSNHQIYIYQTDTVWGIGCDYYSAEGFRAISKIKKTSSTKPLSIIYSSIQQIKDHFNFPVKITNEWLDNFFLFESTLGIPVNWSKEKIPELANMNSTHVSIRCLNLPHIKLLYEKIGNPFFSTSLNLQAEPPILTEEDAKIFQQKYCPDAIICKGPDHIMSGESSTIVFINEINNKLEFEIKRKGKKVTELLVHLELLRLA